MGSRGDRRRRWRRWVVVEEIGGGEKIGGGECLGGGDGRRWEKTRRRVFRRRRWVVEEEIGGGGEKIG